MKAAKRAGLVVALLLSAIMLVRIHAGLVDRAVLRQISASTEHNDLAGFLNTTLPAGTTPDSVRARIRGYVKREFAVAPLSGTARDSVVVERYTYKTRWGAGSFDVIYRDGLVYDSSVGEHRASHTRPISIHEATRLLRVVPR